ncbi:MAG: ketol-acid reductoisomerase [Acidimicrobiales bacterium]
MVDTRFNSEIFPLTEIELDGQPETILAGGRHLYPLLPQAFRGVEEIGVLGWGSQGPAQAQNLRDSLAGTGIRVSVGLRAGSSSAPAARAAGFSESDGTLGELLEVAGRSDLVLLLVSDAAQADLYPQIFEVLTPGSTLGMSHGFLVGHLRAVGDDFPDDVNVIGVCPKGMGPSLRRLYLQGAEIGGCGINTSFAVEHDVDGWASDMALAWAVAIGAPYTFKTTLGSEYRSDIFGERGVLLGAVHGLVEALYRRHREAGVGEEDAFEASAETLTGPIARTISSEGLIGLYRSLDEPGQTTFTRAYAASYRPAAALLAEIYDEVDSGRELAGVVAASRRMERYPMGQIEGTRMWQVGATVRATRSGRNTPVDPFAAGCFAAVMTAQVDCLRQHGHPWSEVANESVIEEVDSLLPYMHARGVAYMVDNCSTTARLGARKWGPCFEALFARIAFPAAESGKADWVAIDDFMGHSVHDVLETIGKFRPAIQIAVE